jgi:hypothetical protein
MKDMLKEYSTVFCKHGNLFMMRVEEAIDHINQAFMKHLKR